MLGHAFCSLALHFIDDLLKMVVITIQACLDGACALLQLHSQHASWHLSSWLHHCQVQSAVHCMAGCCECARDSIPLRSLQIMAEAADAALAAVLQHCRAAALLPHIAGPLADDRSVKLRQCCATHLLQVNM